MKIKYDDADGGRFWADARFEEKDILKSNGFKWFPPFEIAGKRRWYTTDALDAMKLRDYAEGEAKALLETAAVETEKAIEASKAADADIDIPSPEGLEYLPYQKAGIAYALRRDGSLVGDVMGLGKTIQALGIINAKPEIKTVLAIVPASLKLNWKREADKWLVREFSTKVVGGKKNGTFPLGIGQREVGDFVIINYDILKKHQAEILRHDWDLLIVDEAHMLKNPKALRTKNVLGYKPTKKEVETAVRKRRKPPVEVEAIKAKDRVFLTGTPIVNRPVEAFPLFNSLDPKTFGEFFPYAIRYCSAYKNRYGWDFKGASNLEELQEKARASFMIRRTKEEVLPELPPKRRQVIEIAANGNAALIERERRAFAEHEATLEELKAAVELAKASEDEEEYRDAVKALRDGQTAAFTAMSLVRHDTALAKVPTVVEHIKAAVEDDPTHKVVVFAHHRDVIAALSDEFAETSVELHGGTPIEKRQEAVDRFQEDPKVQIFIGQIQAAGVGITLTASSHVIFAELDWVPGNLTQAEDRTHRIGQFADYVLVQHLVLEGSLDAVMAKRVVAKQEVIDRALDNETGGVMTEKVEVPVLPTAGEAATDGTSRKALEKEALNVDPAKVEAVHSCLKALSLVCDGALAEDGTGFNGCDTRIGKSLAAAKNLSPKQAILGSKIIRKYKGQLNAYGLGEAYDLAIAS